MRKGLAALLLAGVCFGAHSADALRIAPEDAPRADASVRAALERGDRELDVIVGVRDGVAYGKAAASRRDGREPERRRKRLAAQDRLSREIGADRMQVRRRYENFPALAARVTRDAILALARRPDVNWITLDRTRRPYPSSPQSAQTLIHSSEVNALGFDGSGRSIAVIDTGVDYTIPDLGGAPFPNAKVVGGVDLGDGDADPMDCEGHGTSVASVAAGSEGVAPGARIVAVKIVHTGTCERAQDSDILAAINWAVTNRDAFDIGVINLSFGGIPTDGQNHGYCDDSLPQYVTAVEAANAVGMVFVASAGNEGLDNAIAEPACLSMALSVGAVYPDSYSSVAWQGGAGGTLCTDAPVAPDTVVCFSNSAPDLSLLAPGAFWEVPTLGGSVGQFHGTSAAAPAVSGTAALLQQARPGIGAAEIGSLLRATGHAVSDPKSGVVTPRIDALAAVRANSESFAAFDGTPVAIPDGSGSAAATATISGFTGTLASVQAVVEIDHADPRQLTVVLTGPDGTHIRLHDRSGSAERPINGVYGKTLAAAQSLGAFQGKDANGTWTLTVTDAVAQVSGRIRNFAVRPVAGQPPAAIPASASASVLPLVGRVQGSKFFLTDARVFNPLPTEQTLSLFYVAQGRSGSQAVVSTRTVGPGRVLALNDLVGSEFGYADSIGQLTVVASTAPVLLTSRAYTPSDNGSFGLFVPSVNSTSGLAAGETSTANGLSKGPKSHTNAGFTEVAGAPVEVRIDLFREDGTLAATTTRDAPANGTVLITDIAGDRGLGTTPNFRLDYAVVEGAGRIAPFATLIDDVTGDGVFQGAARPPLAGDDLIIAQASHASGGNGDFFRTDLYVTNVGAAPAAFTIDLLPRVLAGTPAAAPSHTLAPGQTLELLDVLAGEFGLSDPSAAGLRIHPTSGAPLVVSSRTYVEKFGGTFGFSIPGLPSERAVGSAAGTVAVLQLESTTAASGFRSNFGFAEVAGADAVVRVAAVGGDTGEELGAAQYTVRAGHSFQAAVADLVHGLAVSNVYLRMQVVSGSGRILAYGAAIDNTSGDAIYVPAQGLGAYPVPP
jgi:subtilisin family serine protease